MAARQGTMMRGRCLLLALSFATPLAAQARWFDAGSASALEATATLGVVDDPFAATATSLAVRARVVFGNQVRLVAEIPAAHARQESGLGGTAIGNPYLGIEFTPSGSTRFELGARPSVWKPRTQARSLVFAYGQLLDFDRREAWFVGGSSVRAMAHFGVVPDHGTFATARAGVLGVVVGGSGGDGELLGHYGARAGVVTSDWRFWVGVTGQGLVTEPEGSLSDRTDHQVEITARRRLGKAAIELSLRRFIDTPLRSLVPLAVQLSVTANP